MCSESIFPVTVSTTPGPGYWPRVADEDRFDLDVVRERSCAVSGFRLARVRRTSPARLAGFSRECSEPVSRNANSLQAGSTTKLWLDAWETGLNGCGVVVFESCVVVAPGFWLLVTVAARSSAVELSVDRRRPFERLLTASICGFGVPANDVRPSRTESSGSSCLQPPCPPALLDFRLLEDVCNEADEDVVPLPCCRSIIILGHCRNVRRRHCHWLRHSRQVASIFPARGLRQRTRITIATTTTAGAGLGAAAGAA